MPALIIKAPTPLPPSLSSPTIFLSGTISPPPAPTWQSTLSTSLSHLAVTILNPLRPDWDASWRENRSDARFVTQVNWELDGLERADVVVVYFGAEAKAPVTLLELGLVVGRGKRVVVCCEDGFWKRGNVELLCEKMGVAYVGSLEELRRVVVGMLRELGVSVDG
ncbi:hypothetical protein LHYA1_G001927 [Lachnellula hyalina]|uniref:Nucleoside 2-deoxyribosyltransferase domain-containing protein n=1 Tax=Lachnellula hyalina TaxID=1316788 RepID=A0A8H8U2Y1_9HELO|nr:uncharacterized protein LHYA1_G001927 [Lachnellula hyalina]TVY28571.1 hypothetical protein LHYA1_G001927 [Lachnellula hyalina]